MYHDCTSEHNYKSMRVYIRRLGLEKILVYGSSGTVKSFEFDFLYVIIIPLNANILSWAIVVEFHAHFN